ncbi:MAG: efflux RND transporter permease subunit [Bacteroidota bacterium]|nr:efflux RND transporter permease subunit [Bacteroidota bacterium]
MCNGFDGELLMEDRTYRLERFLTRRNATIVLLLIGLASVFFAIELRNVRLDHDFERFFPTDDPELDRYEAFRERFGNDNDLLMIAAANEPSIFDRSFLGRMDTLALELTDLPDVLSVNTPTRMEEPRFTPLGVFTVPWLRVDNDSTLLQDSARIWRDQRLIGSFISPDGKALLILLQTLPGLSKERSDALLEDATTMIEESGLQDVRMAGRVHGQYWYIEKMKYELALFFTLSVILLTIFLAIGSRTLWGVLVPIGVVGLTVLWQVALITLLGRSLSILTMLLPTILFVVGMSDVVHIMERYIEALRNGIVKQRALAIAYHEVGLATFLTSLTTAIGFATLITSGIMPIREFGLYTAAGVMLAFVLSFTLLPSILLLVRTPVHAARAEKEGFWYPVLSWLFRQVIHFRRWIPVAFAVLIGVSGVFIFNLKVDNFLLEDWAEDDPQKQAYYWFEEHFGGARPFELEVTIIDPQSSIWDLEVLREIELVEEHLRTDQAISAIVSPAVVVRSINKAFNGGAEEFHRLPEDRSEMQRLVKKMDDLPGTEMLSAVVTSDGKKARISGRMKDEGGYVHRQRNMELYRFLKENTNSELVRFDQTGMAFLIDRNNERLSSQLISGLAIAFLLIALIMAAVFKNWRMTLIALIPNIVPLVFIGGVMGIFGIDIKVSTSIIFTIAFGIAVDDTIHMLGKLRIELMKGKSLPYAMKRAFLSTGKALIITSIMLLSGFISLIFSDLASVFYMGLLVSLTLLMALVADLLLLPVLVLKWLPSRSRNTN